MLKQLKKMFSVIDKETEIVEQKAIIEQIHKEFYSEVDLLLADAKISHSLHSDKQDLLTKCERLKALGFTHTKEVQDAQAEVKRISDLEIANRNKTKLYDAIMHFKLKYSFYKFITEDSVKKICAKYNLVYGPIDKYIGTVPDENLKQIEDFKVADSDKCATLAAAYREHRRYNAPPIQLCSGAFNPATIYDDKLYYTRVVMLPLEIVAPLKDFDAKKMELKNFKLSDVEILDPVVLQPVYFGNEKHYLIVTAWGPEASDSAVVNEKMN